jgi:chromosome partitioning protein
MKNFNILVGGEKGGTGKSTVATNIALMLKIAGFDTHLIDCDIQQTSLKFATRRSNQKAFPNLVCTHLAGDQLQIPLVDLAEKYDAIVVDCGGQDSVEMRSAMISPCFNLMIVPVQAGYFDLETLVNMDNLVRISKIYNPKLQAKCLINRATSNKLVTVTQEAQVFINDELEHLGLMETVLHDRVSFSYAVAKGQCVAEYEKKAKRDGKATHEIMSLYKEITGEDFPFSKVVELENNLEASNA